MPVYLRIPEGGKNHLIDTRLKADFTPSKPDFGFENFLEFLSSPYLHLPGVTFFEQDTSTH